MYTSLFEEFADTYSRQEVGTTIIFLVIIIFIDKLIEFYCI